MSIPLNLTFGTDPEVVLTDASQDWKPVSALRVLRRDKHEAIDLGDGIKCYGDNALLEFSMPPEDSPEDMVTGLHKAFTRFQEKQGGARWRIWPKTCQIYDRDELMDVASETQIDEATKKPKLLNHWESGCNPNYDVYKQEKNRAADFTDGSRTGSFHIHIGDIDFDKGGSPLDGIEAKGVAVRLMDIYVGIPSIVMDQDPSSKFRRKLYGKAGEFRPTYYGIEYRVLGNWFLNSPDTTRLIFDLAEYAMGHIKGETAMDVINSIPSDLVTAAINQNSKLIATAVMRKSCLPKCLMSRVEQVWDTDFYTDWKI